MVLRKKVGLWLRVSTDEQTIENQRQGLAELCAVNDFEVAREFLLEGVSGFSESKEYEQVFRAALNSAASGEIQALLVWSLDRFTRQGIEVTLQRLRRFDDLGCPVISRAEAWTQVQIVDGPLGDLMKSIYAWIAQAESKRISERTKAGIARRRAEGKSVGRPKGAKDKRQRRTLGYQLREDRKRKGLN